MHRLTALSATLAAISGILVPPAIVLLGAAPLSSVKVPLAPPVDPFPNLPPLSELARLPSADIAAHWARIQRTVFDDATAKSNDPTLPRKLQSRYEDIAAETIKRMVWLGYIQGAHDLNISERLRRNCLMHLQGMDAYYTGKWPAPVPLELVPEEKP